MKDGYQFIVLLLCGCYADVRTRDLKGQWPINCCTSPMMIHIITPIVDYNLWLKRLDTQFSEPTNQNSVKVPKVVEPTNRTDNVILKLLGLV